MRTLFLSCLSVLTLSLFGCATVAPVAATTPARPSLVRPEEIRVAKSDAPADYVEVGPVEVVHGEGCGLFGTLGTYEGAYARLKARAVAMNADYIQIMEIKKPYKAFRCAVNEFSILATLYRSPEIAGRTEVQAHDPKRCVAHDLPEWQGANAATKKALLQQCRPLAATQAP